MPTYDYECPKCGHGEEIIHGIKENKRPRCPQCKNKVMKKQIGTGYVASSYHAQPTMADRKHNEHTKKVKDFDRAVKRRKKAFGTDAVGNPVDKPDERHIIKRGRHIAGQETEVDKQEFIKAAAKDDAMVKVAQEAVRKSKKKK